MFVVVAMWWSEASTSAPRQPSQGLFNTLFTCLGAACGAVSFLVLPPRTCAMSLRERRGSLAADGLIPRTHDVAAGCRHGDRVVRVIWGGLSGGVCVSVCRSHIGAMLVPISRRSVRTQQSICHWASVSRAAQGSLWIRRVAHTTWRLCLQPRRTVSLPSCASKQNNMPRKEGRTNFHKLG